MANNYFRGTTNSNISLATNWSLGVTPTANDGNVAVWDALSPNCNINTTFACNSADFTNYISTLIQVVNVGFSVYGNLTFGSGMTFNIVTGSLGILNNCQLKTNGVIVSTVISVANGVTITLLDNLVTSKFFGSYGASNFYVNSSTNEIVTCPAINASNGVIINGTAPIYLNGGTNSGNITINNPLFINGNVVFTASMNISGQFNYLSGSITTLNSKITFLPGSSISGFTSTNYIENVYFQGDGNIKLYSDLYCRTLTLGNIANNLILSGSTIYAQSLLSNFTTGGSSGSTIINLNGLGYIRSSGITNTININVPENNIWTGGNWNTAANWSKAVVPSANDGYLTVISGVTGTINIITAACNGLLIDNSTINMNNNILIWGNFMLGSISPILTNTGYLDISRTGALSSSGGTWGNALYVSNQYTVFTLISELTIGGSFRFNGANITLNSLSNETFNVGGLTMSSSALPGTAEIIIKSGTWSGAGTVMNNLIIDGNVTISGSVGIGTFLTHNSGSVIATTSTLNILATSITLPSTIRWNNVFINPLTDIAITLNGLTTLDGLLTFRASGIQFVFSGNYDIYCNSIILGLAGQSTNHYISLSGNIYCNSSSLLLLSGAYSSIINNYKIVFKGISNTSNGTLVGTTVFEFGDGTYNIANLISNPITLNGNVTLQNIKINGGSITYISGTLISTGIVTFRGSNILDLSGKTLNSITLDTSGTIMLIKSECNIFGTLTSAVSTLVSHNLIKSDQVGIQRKLTLLNNTLDLDFVDFTDIDASRGWPIWTYKGIVNNSNNILSLTPYSFIQTYVN